MELNINYSINKQAKVKAIANEIYLSSSDNESESDSE